LTLKHEIAQPMQYEITYFESQIVLNPEKDSELNPNFFPDSDEPKKFQILQDHESVSGTQLEKQKM
jgi:hypothetical protein